MWSGARPLAYPEPSSVQAWCYPLNQNDQKVISQSNRLHTKPSRRTNLLLHTRCYQVLWPLQVRHLPDLPTHKPFSAHAVSPRMRFSFSVRSWPSRGPVRCQRHTGRPLSATRSRRVWLEIALPWKTGENVRFFVLVDECHRSIERPVSVRVR